MRVLLLITRGEPGGAQVHVFDLVRGLQGRVDFQVGLGDDEFLAIELRKLGVPVHVLPALQRAIAPATDRRALRQIRALIREVSPHLVHTHSTKAGLLGRLAAHLEGFSALHTAHAWSFSDGQPRRRKLMAIPPEVIVGRLTERFIVVSAADKAISLRYRVAREDQLRVVHNGVRDVPQRARPDGGDPPTVTMVARMAAPKDHQLILRALAGVDAPFRLQLVGDGPDQASLEALIEALGLGDRVALLGRRDDVPELLADTHIFALISRQEGFPLAILEAMRAGLPVVASDVGGVREAVRHGDTGFLIPRGDEQALRASLRRLLVDPALRRSLGDAGRHTYEKRFSADHMLTNTAAVYRELAADHGWPTPAELS